MFLNKTKFCMTCHKPKYFCMIFPLLEDYQIQNFENVKILKSKF